MANDKRKSNNFFSKAIPNKIKEEHPQFSLFIEKYFDYISRDLGEYDIPSNLLSYIDVDKTVEDFHDNFKKLHMPLIPEKYKSSLSVIIKNINKFYQTKGTEESFKTFFRMIFDSAVNLYYPKVDMLRASDGRWIEPYYLYPTDQDYDTIYYFYDKEIEGSDSNSTAYVKDILQVPDPQNINEKIFILSLVSRTGVFTNADNITVKGEITPSITLDGEDTVITGIGYWEDTDGFLSWNKYIQDSEYYQDYSYVLESSISTSIFEKPIRDNLHPAGMKFFAIVTEGIQIQDLGSALADFVEHIISWIRTETIEHTLSINNEISSIVSAPQYSSGNDFDWKYFELNREESPFPHLYPPMLTLGHLPLDYASDNYPENFVVVKIDGVPTTLFTILNEVLTLDNSLAAASFIIVTTTDYTIPANSREFRFAGKIGQTVFILPTKINRMNIGSDIEDYIITV